MKIVEIYCSHASKDAIVDFLLDQIEEEFYYFPCSRYGAGAFLISAEEQVSARSRFGMFRLSLREDRVYPLSSALKAHLKDKTITIRAYHCDEL